MNHRLRSVVKHEGSSRAEFSLLLECKKNLLFSGASYIRQKQFSYNFRHFRMSYGIVFSTWFNRSLSVKIGQISRQDVDCNDSLFLDFWAFWSFSLRRQYCGGRRFSHSILWKNYTGSRCALFHGFVIKSNCPHARSRMSGHTSSNVALLYGC